MVAEVRSGTVSAKPPRLSHSVSDPVSTVHEQQWADLLSPPVVTPNDLAEGACLTLRYRILSENSELRVLLKPTTAMGEGGAVGGGAGGFRRGERRGHGGRGGGGGHQEKDPEEILLWAQGRVRSPSVMEAVINLDGHEMPRRYQVRIGVAIISCISIVVVIIVIISFITHHNYYIAIIIILIISVDKITIMIITMIIKVHLCC